MRDCGPRLNDDLQLDDNPLVLTKEEAMDAFRRVAKQTHPDVRGGSTASFQRAQEAISVLSQELPSQDDLIKARAAHIDLMEEQRFSKRRGMGSLLAAPRGIFQKLKLNVKMELGDRLAASRDYIFEKAKSAERPVEATGRAVTTQEQLELEREMEELKLEELRAKGVGRMVDSLISDAIREGLRKRFQSLLVLIRPCRKVFESIRERETIGCMSLA